ncbi:TATA box-binding protein-associated factor RNA polymerase I subunit C [Centropristis striata]|uniref:TATA box-binding protein-associated factor RNA polymerase I subunit C n=1 Tax=Centropristis striata TaxID=184440 RepID=UPI0027DF0BBF|nr:TATA box-binding protein-associated factor RNA polymerase I subunit C [Centropristis striata]
MDYQFPQQLFPSFYNCGPPDSVHKHNAGKWGSYSRVRPQGGSGPLSSWTFTSRHQVRGETWRHTEPAPLPLLSPKNSVLWPLKPPDPEHDFQKHMQNFFVDHCQDAFGCMGEILSENFNFKQGRKEKYRRDSVHMWKVKNVLDALEFNICLKSYTPRVLRGYSSLLGDVVPAVPPELLGSLLYEELTEQRDRMLFSEGATGGALAFVPFSQSSSDSQRGCLLYPGNKARDCLNFHRVELQHHREGPTCVDASSSDPFRFQLKAPVRQISSASLFNDCCVAVRSDHLCGVWRFSETNAPRLLQVVNTREVATCVSVSPHVLGEVLVASESGAANLWTVGRGMQKVREDDENLYFNANSSWRWCEFSAHPRVMLYADRTGVELTDIRVSPVSSHTLFRISNTPECLSGERVILSRYLGDVHPFHHLVTTQFSAYVMDERFPCMPMLKWDHMMESPPMFCHAVCGSAPSKTTKVLLGSHSSQEITLLQYSGGRVEACSSRGPPQALLRARDSLKHLPVQIPHRLDIATSRLSSPAAGLTCIQRTGGGEAGGEECMCVLQLTEAGDIFYQILEPEQPDISRPPADDEPFSQQASQTVISDTSSDEDVIGPTQRPTVPRFVPETQQASDSSSEDSESRRKPGYLKRLGLQTIINEDPEIDQVSGLDAVVEDGNVGEDNTDRTEEPVGVSSSLAHVGSSEHQAPVKLSDGALVTWKHWLQKLMRKSRGKRLNPQQLKLFTMKTGDLLNLSEDKAIDPTEEERVQSLRRDLRACMSKRSLLVHSAVSASLGAPDVVMVPDPVDPGAWNDQISRRLTLSWRGEEAWRAWWEEELGLNRDAKVEALRRKRRRQKEARRAAGRGLELASSFTSSVSYQSELGDFSDSAGWSSAASQGAWSDSEGKLSQLEAFSEQGRATTPSTMQTDTPVPTSTPLTQSYRDKQGETPSSSHTLTPSQTPRPDSTASSQRRNKRPAEDLLSSLFAPQDEPSQHGSYFLEEGSIMRHPPPTVAGSSSQLRSSQSVPQRSFRMDPSQESSLWSGFSQSQSLSQSSQGRLGSSQTSQPKRKKSRMGF